MLPTAFATVNYLMRFTITASEVNKVEPQSLTVIIIVMSQCKVFYFIHTLYIRVFVYYTLLSFKTLNISIHGYI